MMMEGQLRIDGMSSTCKQREKKLPLITLISNIIYLPYLLNPISFWFSSPMFTNLHLKIKSKISS